MRARIAIHRVYCGTFLQIVKGCCAGDRRAPAATNATIHGTRLRWSKNRIFLSLARAQHGNFLNAQAFAERPLNTNFSIAFANPSSSFVEVT
jgi:hypothetical protein